MSNPVTLTHHRITVLLVDDQPMIGEAVRRMLSSEHDIDFHYCPDPIQAIKTANQVAPTVILQDLVMPEIDGLTLVRYFRANQPTREVPLIVLSSKEEPITKAEAFALGANDYLVKLPDKLEVLARIRYHSKGYINLLERNEAYNALLESQQQLELRNRFIQQTFGRYLSDEIVKTILETPEGLKIGGEKRVVTIMMTDLRGFTSTCERLPAEDVVNMLNVYLEAMTEIILKYQGTIVEFIGDAILAIFGAPLMRENDAERAVTCALEMQAAMTAVNQQNREIGYPEIAMGIGLNTGDVIVGNIGSRKRTKYGIVGRNVNLASRIESYTVGGQILISQDTLLACRPILKVRAQMEVMPKGMKEPLTIYHIVGIGGEFSIYLSEERTEFFELAPPLPIRFSVLEGKHDNQAFYLGKVLRLAEHEAEIQAERGFRELTNLRMTLIDREGQEVSSELYAKVIETASDSPLVFRVNFTALPPEAVQFFRNLLEGTRT